MATLKTLLIAAGCTALLGVSVAQASYQPPGGIEAGIGDRSWAVTGPHYQSGDYAVRISNNGSPKLQLPGGMSPGIGDRTWAVTGPHYRVGDFPARVSTDGSTSQQLPGGL